MVHTATNLDIGRHSLKTDQSRPIIPRRGIKAEMYKYKYEYKYRVQSK